MTQAAKVATHGQMLDAAVRHQLAWRRFSEAIRKQDDLENDAPAALKRAVEKEWNAANREESAARRGLVSTVPCDALSLVVMLDHIDTYTEPGYGVHEFFGVEGTIEIFFRTIKKFARGAVGFPLASPRSRRIAKKAA